MRFRLIIIFIIHLLLISCKDAEISEVERIIVNDSVIQNKVKGYDSIATDSSKKFIETKYFLKDDITLSVFKDSINRIRAWWKYDKGEIIDGNEVHIETGQIISNVIDLNSKIKHYYPDGRIKITGELKNGERIGEWKFYDSTGKLEQFSLYNDEGEIIKSEKEK